MASKRPAWNVGFCRIALHRNEAKSPPCKPQKERDLPPKPQSQERMPMSESFTKTTGADSARRVLAPEIAIRLFSIKRLECLDLGGVMSGCHDSTGAPESVAPQVH